MVFISLVEVDFGKNKHTCNTRWIGLTILGIDIGQFFSCTYSRRLLFFEVISETSFICDLNGKIFLIGIFV